jgi:HlyD family secretion protein
MTRILKPAIFLIVVAAGVLGLVYAFQPQPIAADFETVERGAMQVTIDEEGETRLDARFVVSAPLAGRILRIDLEPGDPVSAGQTVVATLLPSTPSFLDARAVAEAQARERAAEAAVGRAEANGARIREELAFAEAQRDRYAELYEQGLASRERFDTADFELRNTQEALNVAQFEVRDAQRAVDVAQASLLQVTEDLAGAESGDPIALRSPIDGTVLRRMRESASVVPAGEPLVELGDVTHIEIVSDLLSEDAVQVRSGQRVLVEQWGGGMTLEGRVQRVEPSGFTKLSALGVEEQRVNVIIDFVDGVQASEFLGDGYRVEIRVVTWESDDVLKLPVSSLFRTDGDWSVFTVDGGIASVRNVEIGRRNGLEAEVLSGISEGETVIVHPSDDVADGVEVVSRGTF